MVDYEATLTDNHINISLHNKYLTVCIDANIWIVAEGPFMALLTPFFGIRKVVIIRWQPSNSKLRVMQTRIDCYWSHFCDTFWSKILCFVGPLICCFSKRIQVIDLWPYSTSNHACFQLCCMLLEVIQDYITWVCRRNSENNLSAVLIGLSIQMLVQSK